MGCCYSFLHIQPPIVIEATPLATDECPITLEQLSPSRTFETSCGHKFEEQALMAWIQKNHTCPVCREPLITV